MPSCLSSIFGSEHKDVARRWEETEGNETPKDSTQKNWKKATLCIDIAIFVIGIVAAAGSWHHGILALSATAGALSLVRLAIRISTGKLKPQDWVLEILTTLGLLIPSSIAAINGSINTINVGHAIWASTFVQFLIEGASKEQSDKS